MMVELIQTLFLKLAHKVPNVPVQWETCDCGPIRFKPKYWSSAKMSNKLDQKLHCLHCGRYGTAGPEDNDNEVFENPCINYSIVDCFCKSTN